MMVRIQHTSGVKPKKLTPLPYRPKGGKGPSWKDESIAQYKYISDHIRGMKHDTDSPPRN